MTLSGQPPADATSRRAAQLRADRVAAFRAELVALEEEGVALDAESRRRVDAHHERLLAELAARFDVDLGAGAQRLSLAMRSASLVAALALAASFYYAIHQVWGLIAIPLRVAILVLVPLAGLALTAAAGRRDRSGYFAALGGLFALAAFVLGVVALAELFDMRPSPNAFLAWGAAGVVIGFGWGLRLPLAVGLGALLVWSAAAPMVWSGHPWTAAWERPEMFLPGALVLVALPFVSAAVRREEAAVPFRLVGGVALLLALVVLGSWGRGSFLPWSPAVIEGLYQVAGFLTAGTLVALGIRRGWQDLVHLGTVGLLVLLWMKFVDWWWDWLPKSLFFLLVALTAIAALLVLARWRRRPKERR